jgi:hypothetical protein
MRSIVLLILAAMVLSTVADAGCGCGGGGGIDGIGGQKMMSNIFPVDDTIRGPQMTYEVDARYGVAVIIDPTGKASMAFVGGEDARDLAVPAQDVCVTCSENLPFGQEVTAHLNDVQMDFNAYREIWEA